MKTMVLDLLEDIALHLALPPKLIRFFTLFREVTYQLGILHLKV